MLTYPQSFFVEILDLNTMLATFKQDLGRTNACCIKILHRYILPFICFRLVHYIEYQEDITSCY